MMVSERGCCDDLAIDGIETGWAMRALREWMKDEGYMVTGTVENAPATPFAARSLKSVLASHTLESLIESGQAVYFSDVTKGPTGHNLRDGMGPEIAYDLTLMDTNGVRMGKVRIVKPAIGEQLESAGVVGEGPDEWFGPVRFTKNGRTYRVEAAD